MQKKLKIYIKNKINTLKRITPFYVQLSSFFRKTRWQAKSSNFVMKYHNYGEKNQLLNLHCKNPLEIYFDNHNKGKGIWKWRHYFDIYHRHFLKFIDQKVNILEVGIYSGGSLEMWRSYFGDQCHVYGVDIEEACKCYENDYTTVYYGDQADRNFWKTLRENTPPIDIIIDDGGHTPEQQRVTLEEMLPYLRCGGIYICEDIHQKHNNFGVYASELIYELNKWGELSEFQKSIHSIHFYPFCLVIEKHAIMPDKFEAIKRGTPWQPFFEN